MHRNGEKLLEIESSEYFIEQTKVIELFLAGNDPTDIGKQLGVKRTRVLDHLDEFKKISLNDEMMRARGRESVNEYDHQQTIIIKTIWETIEELDTIGGVNSLRVKATLLKNLADIQAKRVEVLQRSGLINDSALGDELAELEEKQDVLVKILRDRLCDRCKNLVASDLARVSGQPEEIIPIYEVTEPDG